MPPLYVIEQGAVLARQGERLVVRREGQVLLSVPAFKVEAVALFGHVQVTTQALELLASRGVDVGFFTMQGRLKGRFVATISRNVVLRVRQFERARDDAFARRLATRLVWAKIGNARRVVMRFARNHPEAPLGDAVERLRAFQEQALEAPGIETVRGIEGAASATYFRAFGHMVRRSFTFEGRQRRPPRDPVNALLSLGYTLLMNEVLGRLSVHGFDPYLGFYHTLRYGRPSLALDMMEELRHPVVDRLVLRVVNHQMLKPADFTVREEDGAVRLTPPALKRFLNAYEAAMRRPLTWRRNRPADMPADRHVTFRDVIDLQVRRLAHAVQSGTGYQPFEWEG